MFDLDAIGRALEELDTWDTADEPPARGAGHGFDDARRRLLIGYGFVDRLLATGEDPFVFGGSRLLLELNHIVLCGATPARRVEFARHIAATERRFYEDHECGADSFYDWAEANHRLQPVVFAAGVYRRIVGAPQLFIEGNQRTATLVASFVLGRGGLSPLVWTRDVFEAFAHLSAQCKALDRRGLFSIILGAGLDWRLQSAISRLAENRRFLVDRGACRQTPPGATGA